MEIYSEVIENQQMNMHFQFRNLEMFSSFLQRKVSIEILQNETFDELAPPALLILNDGQDLIRLRMEETLNSLSESFKLPKIIIAAVTAGQRKAEFGVSGTPDFQNRGAKASDYELFIVNELLPHIESLSGWSTTPVCTAIAGTSLGGLSALDIATSHPHRFGIAGVLSGSLWWRSKSYEEGYLETDRIIFSKMNQISLPSYFRCWLMAGTNDESYDRNANGVIDAVDDTIDMYELLVGKSLLDHPDEKIRLHIVDGGTHDTGTWENAYRDFILFAFGT